MADTLQRLIDREEIRDVLARYCRHVDRRDWEAVRTVYHPDATDDHGDYRGNIDGFIAWVRERHAQVAQSMHFTGNVLIEFAADDVAIVETYFVAFQTLGPEAGEAARKILSGGSARPDQPIQTSMFGRYLDRMERRGGPWKIARRVLVLEAIRVDTGAAPPLKPEWAQVRRDRDDPIYHLRREAGLAD